MHEFKEIGSKPGALDLGLADHGDRGRERIGGEHIGVRATRDDEFAGREAAGREGGAGREGVAKVMYTTRAEGREGGAYGREGGYREGGGTAYEEEEEHHRGLMGKVSDTMHKMGAKLTGKE